MNVTAVPACMKEHVLMGSMAIHATAQQAMMECTVKMVRKLILFLRHFTFKSSLD